MLFEDDHDDISSVDIPRHNSNQHLSFRSFEHPSHLDSEVFSRHGDEDSLAMDPEFGLTMSTAAHHASALTINAGLGGRHRSPSRANDSRAEFDPERPLQPMLSKKLTEGMSMFDTTNRSRSKSFKATGREQVRLAVSPSVFILMRYSAPEILSLSIPMSTLTAIFKPDTVFPAPTTQKQHTPIN